MLSHFLLLVNDFLAIFSEYFAFFLIVHRKRQNEAPVLQRVCNTYARALPDIPPRGDRQNQLRFQHRNGGQCPAVPHLRKTPADTDAHGNGESNHS